MKYEITKIKDSDKMFPKKLLNINNHPKQIYVIGNASLLNNKSVAVVGSRDATEYGKKYAKIFAKEISKKGITIVSGLAMGIDTVAHKNSMYEVRKNYCCCWSWI